MSAAEVMLVGAWGMLPWDLLLAMLLRAKPLPESAARACSGRTGQLDEVPAVLRTGMCKVCTGLIPKAIIRSSWTQTGLMSPGRPSNWQGLTGDHSCMQPCLTAVEGGLATAVSAQSGS